MNVQSIVSANLTHDWRKFARAMFMLEDADPGYMLLKRAKLPYATKLRYVLAWCTFYNPGIAAVACQYQGEDFYQFLRNVYPDAKRASERRHFRGRAGLLALNQWQREYPKPEEMIEECYAPTYLGVRQNMKPMAQMGDYFYWKLADIWDTVFDNPVDFTGCERYMPKVPKQGADIIYGMEQSIVVGHAFSQEQWLVPVMAEITQHVEKIDYPVKGGRKLALQEAETVCCVFKQHVHGDYRLGFRSAKAYRRLIGVTTKPAAALLEGLYAGGIWTPASLIEVGEHL
jgi:hypothetical protein